MPWAMFLREAVGLARGPARRTALLAAVIAGLLGLGAYSLVANATGGPAMDGLRRWLPDGPVAQRAMARRAAALFQMAEVWLVALLAPGAFAALFSQDRARGRLDLLLTTHVSRTEIVAGKYLSRFLWGAGLLALPAPILLWLNQFAGLEIGILAERYAVAVLALTGAGALGLCCGAWCRTPVAAALLAYLLLAIAWVVAPIGWWEAMIRPGPLAFWPRGACEVWRFSPVFSASFWPDHHYFRIIWAELGLLEQAFEQLPVVALLLLATPFGLRPSEPPRRRRRRWRWTPARWGGVFPVSDPLWLRARQAPVHDRSRALRWTNLLPIALYGLAYFSRNPETWLGMVPAAAVAVIGISAAFAATADRQNGFLDQVLLTALSPGEIHRGYVRALAEHLRVPIAATLVLSVYTYFRGHFPDWRFAAMGVVQWAVFCAVLLRIAVALGLWARNATEAWLFLALTLAVGGVVGVGVPSFLATPWMWAAPADQQDLILLIRIAVVATICLALGLRYFRGAWPAILATVLSPVLVYGPFAILPTEWNKWRDVGNAWYWGHAPILEQAGYFLGSGARAYSQRPDSLALLADFWLRWGLHLAGLLALGWLASRLFAVNFDRVFRPPDPQRRAAAAGSPR